MSNFTVTMDHHYFNTNLKLFVDRLTKEVKVQVEDIREMARNVSRLGNLKPRWFETKRSKGHDIADSVEVEIENARGRWTYGIFYERERVAYPLLFEKITTMRNAARKLAYAADLLEGSHASTSGSTVTIEAHHYNKDIFGEVD